MLGPSFWHASSSCCAASVPSNRGGGAHDSDGATDYGELRETVSDYLSRTGEAGFILNIEDEDALKLLDVIADTFGGPVLRGSATGICEYLNDTESPTMEGLIEAFSDNGNTCEISIDLTLAADIESVKEDSGEHTYTMRIHGAFDFQMEEVLGVHDLDNPNADLRGTRESASLDSLIVVKLNDRNEFVSLAVASEETYILAVSSNWEYDDHASEYRLLDENRDTEDSVTMSTSLLLESEGISGDDAVAFLDGLKEGKIVAPEKDISFMFSNIEKRYGLEGIIAIDMRMPLSELAALVPEDPEAGEDYDEYIELIRELRGSTAYTTVQNVLEAFGLFVSEEELKDLRRTVMDGSRYFFETPRQSYNTVLRSDIDSVLSAVPSAVPEPLVKDDDGAWTESDHAVLFEKDLAWSGVRCDALLKEGATLPDKVFGYPVEDDSDAWGLQVYLDCDEVNGWDGNGIGSDTFYVAGSPGGVSFELLRDGIKDADLLASIVRTVEPIDGLVDGWKVGFRIADISEFQNCRLIVSWDIGYREYVLNYSSAAVPDDWTAIVDGTKYSYGLDERAIIIGDGDGDGRIVVPTDVNIGGATYEVGSISGIRCDSLTIVLPKGSDLPYMTGCSIESLTIECGGSNDLYLEYINNVGSLKNLDITGDVWETSGRVNLEGYTGFGASVVIDGIIYTLDALKGEPCVTAAETVDGITEATVPSHVTIGGTQYPVHILNLSGLRLDTITLEADVHRIHGNFDDVKNLIIRGQETFHWIVNMFIECHAGQDGCSLTIQVKDSDGNWTDSLIMTSFPPQGIFEVDGASYRVSIDADGPYARFVGFVSPEATIKSAVVYNGMTLRGPSFISANGDDVVKRLIVESSTTNIFMDRSTVKSIVFNNTAPFDAALSFEECSDLESVTFNGPFKDIPSRAFYRSTEIAELNFNSTVDSIGMDAFASISRMTSLVFHKDVGTICSSAFGSCTNLGSVTFEGAVRTIGWDAFQYCGKMESMVFKDVDTLHGSSGCDALRTITVNGSVEVLSISDHTGMRSPTVTENGKTLRPEFNISVAGSIESIPYDSFSGFHLKKETIASLLTQSVTAYPRAFDNVITGYNEKGEEITYTGICSGDIIWRTVDGVEYTFSLYIDGGKTALDLIGLDFFYTDTRDIEINEFDIDGNVLPIKSICFDSAFSSNNEDPLAINLTIGKNVDRMGSLASFMFQNISISSFESNSVSITAEKYCGAWIVKNQGKVTCIIGTPDGTEFRVPDGLERFDLKLINNCRIESFDTGNAATIDGRWDYLPDLENLNIGPATTSIPSDSIPIGLKNVTVDDRNTCFAVADGALYGITRNGTDACASLLMCFAGARESFTVPASILDGIPVRSIGSYAFDSTEIGKIVVSSGIQNIGSNAFDGCKAREIVLPDTLSSLGRYAFHGCDKDLIVSSADGRVKTVDGAVYFTNDGTKTLAGYVGDSRYLLVEEGTTHILIREHVDYLIAPQETVYIHADATHMLIPSGAMIDGKKEHPASNWIRTYTISDDYDVSISLVGSGEAVTGVKIEYTMESYAELKDVTFIEIGETVKSLAPSDTDKKIVHVSGVLEGAVYSADQKVYIEKDTVFHGTMEVYNLIIEADATLTVENGSALKILDGGSLIVNGTLDIQGALNIGSNVSMEVWGKIRSGGSSDILTPEGFLISLGYDSEISLAAGTEITNNLLVSSGKKDWDLIGTLADTVHINGPSSKVHGIQGIIGGGEHDILCITGNAWITKGEVTVTDRLYIDAGALLSIKNGASIRITAGATVVINGTFSFQARVDIDLNKLNWSSIWGCGQIVQGEEPAEKKMGSAFELTWSELFPKSGTFNGTSMVYGGNDADISAHYDVKRFTVEFDTGTDAVTVQSESVEGGTTVDAPDVPVRAGFEFEGWYTDASLTSVYDFRDPVTSDMTLYAKWKADGTPSTETGEFRGCKLYIESSEGMNNRFSVDGRSMEWTYARNMDPNGGDTMYYVLYLSPGEHTILPGFIHGYHGDAIEVDLKKGEGVVYTTCIVPYTVTKDRVTVSFVNDDSKGSVDAGSIDLDIYSDLSDLPEAEAKGGYRFVGWVSNHTIVDRLYVQDRDIVLTAGYIRLDTYTVTFEIQDGRGTVRGDSTLTAEYGATISLPDVAPANGYRFAGWYIDGQRIQGGTYTVTGDATIVASMVRTYVPGGSQGGATPGGQQPGGSQTIVDDDGNKTTITTDRNGNTTSTTTKTDGTVISSTTSRDGSTTETEKRTDGTVTTTTTSKDGSTSTRTDNPDGSSESVSTSKDGTVTKTETAADGSGTSLTERTDGSTTKVEKEADGSSKVTDTVKTDEGTVSVEKSFDDRGNHLGSTETTTVESDEGTVSKSTEYDAHGKPTGKTSETVTSKDGSAVRTETVEKDNGTSVKEEVFDRDGVLTGTTTKETEASVTDTGTRIESTTTTAADGDGNVLGSTTEIRAESDSGDVTTSATVTTDSGGNTVSESETVIASSSDNGSITVDRTAIDDALRQMQEVEDAAGGDVLKTVTISTSEYTPDKADLTISGEDLKVIADSGAGMKLAGDVGTVTVSPSASRNLATSGEAVNVSIGKASKAGLNPVQQSMVGENPVFQLEATVGADSVHELGGDVTVTVPYILKDGEDPNGIIVYYVDDDGGLHARTTSYDAATNTVTFVTDHFSYYMIGGSGIETLPPAAEEDDADGTVWIAAVAAIVIVVAVVAAVIRSKAR